MDESFTILINKNCIIIIWAPRRGSVTDAILSSLKSHTPTCMLISQSIGCER